MHIRFCDDNNCNNRVFIIMSMIVFYRFALHRKGLKRQKVNERNHVDSEAVCAKKTT